MSNTVVARTLLFSLLGAVAAGTLQCSTPPAETILLDCSAGEIRHVLRIDADAGRVEDLSSVPPILGNATVTEDEYILGFFDPRDDFELRLRIDRATGRGTRVLIDHEGLVPPGHGGEDPLVCTPRTDGR